MNKDDLKIGEKYNYHNFSFYVNSFTKLKNENDYNALVNIIIESMTEDEFIYLDSYSDDIVNEKGRKQPNLMVLTKEIKDKLDRNISLYLLSN